jgi:hypothetical protein
MLIIYIHIGVLKYILYYSILFQKYDRIKMITLMKDFPQSFWCFSESIVKPFFGP